ncbi:MAG: DUF2938 domain-containing protein [Chloroflexi bacterium HGW-Chloroflexi-10]|nr:MAG: DUF2938 domain-containing protein [Chloroflexi bacterium HGW-Chloroflexi-10]
MNNLTLSFISAILIGLGATLTFDLWAQFLKHAFKITPSNICLVGRWLRYMPEGTFRHTNIGSAPRKSAECALGWVAHYMIGVTFAITFVLLVGSDWLQNPTPVPAIAFGVITVLAPFFIMQPSFGLGLAASKTLNPAQARLRSLMNHTAFGVGMYIFGLLANLLLRLSA